jgi:hypothetical protein
MSLLDVDNEVSPSTDGRRSEENGATSGTSDAEDRNSTVSRGRGQDDTQDGGVGGERSSSPHPHLDHAMEGYAPLNFNLNELVMMHDGSDGDSDDGDNFAMVNEEMNGDLYSNGYYHMMGAPPRRVNGVKNSAFGYAISHDYDHDDDGDSSHTDMSNNGNGNLDNDSGDADANSMHSLEVPDDFHLLAERALRGLEIEHSATLEMMSTDVTNEYESNENLVETSQLTQFTASFPSFTEEESDGAMMQKGEALFPDESNMPIESATHPPIALAAAAGVGATTKQLKESKSIKSKPIDINAIQKAMQSIRLKAPQFATTLDAGALSSFSTCAADIATDSALASIINFTSRVMEQSRDKQLQTHNIIPAVPLAAFRRVTPKAQAASANLSRSATLSEAVLRLWPLICFRRKMSVTGLGASQHQPIRSSKTLTIHILGADGIECSSEALVHKLVGPFVRWLNAALHSGSLGESNGAEIAAQSIDTLLIEFSGPNVPSAMDGRTLDLLPSPITQMGGLTTAKAIFHQREYHEVPSCIDDVDEPADLSIAFNAGIWGYDTWKPTIECMIRGNNIDSPANDRMSLIGNTLFVITAYTLEESEDDASVITEVVETIAINKSIKLQENSNAIARQLWAPELNPFSSRLERFTASAPPGRKYFENAAWQAWLLGL